MEIKVSSQSMLHDLLQDNNERLHQFFEVRWSLLDLIKEVIEGSIHDRGIFIAESSFHLDIKLIDWGHFVEADQHHDSFFPNQLMRMVHQLMDDLADCRNYMHMTQLRNHIQSSHNFQMILRLEVFLDRGDQQDQYVT